MADHLIPPDPDEAPARPPAAPPQCRPYKLIVSCFVGFAAPAVLSLLMIIFLVIPAGMTPGLGLDLGSSLLSLNVSISISHSKLVAVEHTHLKILLSSDGQLSLSRPALVSTTLTQAPGCGTSAGAKVLTMLSIVTDLSVNGREVTIGMAVKAERRLRLGPWWVAVLDVSCTDLTFVAPSDSEGGDHRRILKGTLSCSLNIIPQL